MYKVKPYYDADTPTQVSDCMYKLPTLQDSCVKHTKEHKMVQLELDPEIIQPEVHGKPLGTKDHPILVNKDEKPLVKENLETIQYPHKPSAVKDDLILDRTRIRRDSDKSQRLEGDIDASVIIALESRQEAILQRLQDLQSQVAQVTHSSSDRSAGTASKQESHTGVRDIVLSAHPSHPPLSLFVLQNLLARQYKMMTSCHCHSSVSDVPDKLRNAFEKADTINRSKYEMVFTVMWKDVKHGPTLMVSPKSHILLEGEGTLARYLARLLNPSYDSTDSVIATEIDQWVDTMNQFQCGNNKEKNAILKSMNSKLGKGDWLVGNGLSLADVVMWSVVVGNDGAPNNVKAWCERCSEREEFRTVLDKFCV